MVINLSCSVSRVVGFVFQTLWFVKPCRAWLPFRGCSAATQSKRCPARVAQQSNTTKATHVTGEWKHPRQNFCCVRSFGSYPSGESIKGILEPHNIVSMTNEKSTFLPGSLLQISYWHTKEQCSQPCLRLHPNSILPPNS